MSWNCYKSATEKSFNEHPKAVKSHLLAAEMLWNNHQITIKKTRKSHEIARNLLLKSHRTTTKASSKAPQKTKIWPLQITPINAKICRDFTICKINPHFGPFCTSKADPENGQKAEEILRFVKLVTFLAFLVYWECQNRPTNCKVTAH